MTCTGKNASVILGMLILLSAPSFTSAETIVHLDRQRHEQTAASPPTVQAPVEERTIEESPPPAIAGEPLAKPTEVAGPTVRAKDTAADASAITSGHYFDAFEWEGPKLDARFGEGGDIAQLSSSHTITSNFTYRNKETNEFINFTVMKWRLAWALGADYTFFFGVSYQLNTPLVVNKNNQPLFELDVNGSFKIVKIRKVPEYSPNGFHKVTSYVKLLDELYVPNAKVTLLIPTRAGALERIPIPPEVIKQWRDVSSIDLKNARQEYDKQ